ncbi:MAG TPA: hypothetical protein VF008_23415 [Niastella sp.]
MKTVKTGCAVFLLLALLGSCKKDGQTTEEEKEETSANVYIEGVVVANDTLYAFKKGSSIKQLVTIDVKTGKEMTATDLNIPGDNLYSLVYYPASDEIMGLSADYKKLIKFNRVERTINTLVLATESYVDYMALAVAGKTLYVHKRTNVNPPDRTVVTDNMGTLDPVNGNFSITYTPSGYVEKRYKSLIYTHHANMLIGTTDTKMVYEYKLTPNLFAGISFGSEPFVSYSGVVSNELPAE